MGLIAVGILGISGIHYYLWRRLIHATTRPGRVRRLLTWIAVALSVLVILTLAGGRLLPWGAYRPLAWPGYVWLAVIFYLLVFLLILEIPRALALSAARRAGRRAWADRPGLPRDALVPLTTTGSAGPGLVDPDEPPAEPRKTPDQSDISVSETPGTPVLAGVHRRLFISRTAALIAGAGALATVGFGMREALGDPTVKRVRVTLSKLDPRMSGLRIAVVSDIHLGPLSGVGHTRRIVQMINALRADVVTIVGDLVDGSVAELGALARPLHDLESRYGAYFVTGNHEYYTPNGPAEWEAELASFGIRPLRNERLQIRHAGGVLDLAGVNDLTGRSSGDGPDLRRALGGRDTSRPVVLLAHQPIQVEQAAGYGVDLQLSGHTHGGQMMPFNLIVGLQQPVIAGLARVRGTQIYVTRGAGYWGPPVRVGAPPEIALVELRSGR